MIRVTTIAAIAVAIMLAGCGQKGPLRLDPPKQPAPAVTTPAPATPAGPGAPAPTTPDTAPTPASDSKSP